MKIEKILPDVYLVVGFCAAVYGCWLIYHPSAFVVAGAMLLYASKPKLPKGK